MVAMEICGSRQRKNGIRKREVCSAESTPVEPMKITPSQVSKGNQYLRNDLSLVFNEAVSVWESFPFTTGEKRPRRKGGSAPKAFGGDVNSCPECFRRHFLASRSRRRRLLDPPAHPTRSRHLPGQSATACRAGAATSPNSSRV